MLCDSSLCLVMKKEEYVMILKKKPQAVSRKTGSGSSNMAMTQNICEQTLLVKNQSKRYWLVCTKAGLECYWKSVGWTKDQGPSWNTTKFGGSWEIHQREMGSLRTTSNNCSRILSSSVWGLFHLHLQGYLITQVVSFVKLWRGQWKHRSVSKASPFPGKVSVGNWKTSILPQW